MHSLVVPVACAGLEVPAWLIAPFVVLILLIAVMPLTRGRLRGLWDRGHFWVAAGLGAVVAAWYVAQGAEGVAVMRDALRDYASFIVLVGSLFTVAGGLHVGVRGAATPGENTRFLAFGALAANLVGTTGASMILIRPWLRMNAGRAAPHHVVFFIFLVSNCGGALTPIGDPPLFLGYLRGVPFFWLAGRALGPWLTVVLALLAVFWWMDRRAFRAALEPLKRAAAEPETLSLVGGINLVFLAVVVAAVFLPADPAGLREAVMLLAAVASHRLTPRGVHATNGFSFGPVREVAALFLGIFVTMSPALGSISRHGGELGVDRPMEFFVAAGSLSAVLDNAPTYATFFELASSSARAESGAGGGDGDVGAGAEAAQDGEWTTADLLAATPGRVIAVSLGAVFFGAMTYIGNGPNFMVKAIAEEAGAPAPGFFGYVLRYALPILLPILLAAGWLWL